MIAPLDTLLTNPAARRSAIKPRANRPMTMIRRVQNASKDGRFLVFANLWMLYMAGVFYRRETLRPQRW